MPEFIIDLSDPRKKRALLTKLGALSGVYRMNVVRFRKRRSDRQNRFYHPCVKVPFGHFLREQGMPLPPGIRTYDDFAHSVLKRKFLSTPVVNPETGEAMLDPATGEPLVTEGSTKELDTQQFNEFVEACAAWLHDMFNFVLPDPSEYREKEEAAA